MWYYFIWSLVFKNFSYRGLLPCCLIYVKVQDAILLHSYFKTKNVTRVRQTFFGCVNICQLLLLPWNTWFILWNLYSSMTSNLFIHIVKHILFHVLQSIHTSKMVSNRFYNLMDFTKYVHAKSGLASFLKFIFKMSFNYIIQLCTLKTEK